MNALQFTALLAVEVFHDPMLLALLGLASFIVAAMGFYAFESIRECRRMDRIIREDGGAR